jgi:hypothetical protein
LIAIGFWIDACEMIRGTKTAFKKGTTFTLLAMNATELGLANDAAILEEARTLRQGI